MSYIIPNQQTKDIKQLNQNETSGSLFVTKNISIEKLGQIKLSPAVIATLTRDDSADFDTVDSMFKTDNGLYLNSKEVWYANTVGLNKPTSLSGDTNRPTPAVEEDGIFFNDYEVISDDSSIYYRSGSSAWTDISLSLTSGAPTQMAVFDAFSSLLVGNSDTVKMVDSTWTVTKTLTLPKGYQITTMDVNNNTAYIGTRHTANGEAKVFIWDGTSTGHNGSFGVGSFEVFALRAYQQSCAIITSAGELKQFNGGGFTRLALLPVYYDNKSWADPLNDHSKISNRGMAVDGEYIYIRLDSQCDARDGYFSPTFPGGVWCYDPNVGLYCKYTPSFTKVRSVNLSTSDVNPTTDVITLSTAPITGTPIIYEIVGSTSIGITAFTPYFAINISSTTIKLASTYADALAGVAVDLTSTGNSFQKLYIVDTNDYGWSMAGARGAVDVLTPLIANNNAIAERVVFTAELHAKQNAGTGRTAFNVVNHKLPNIGYFITPKLNSSSLEETYGRIGIKFKELKTDDVIEVKYKLVDKPNMPRASMGSNLNTAIVGKTGTWTSTTTFTTPYDLSDASVGDEIEITSGVGAGFMAHISSITSNSGTYTVTLDEAFIFAVNNDVMFFAIDNWTKVLKITNSNKTGHGYHTLPIDKNSKFVQLKIVLRGVGIIVEELQVGNKAFKPLI